MLRFAVPLLLSSSILLLSLTGCTGSIAVVEDARTGGTVALHGAEGRAREKAEAHMTARCAGAYEIVEEGEAISVAGDREWRIVYACKGTTGRRTPLVF